MLIFFTLFSVQAEPSCILDQCDNAEVTPTSTQQSVLEQPLKPCGTTPITVIFRDGFCHTNDQDREDTRRVRRVNHGILELYETSRQ